jgi:hypothetical protein
VEPVSEDLALEDLIGELDIETALEKFLDGGREDPGALVVVALEVLSLEQGDAQVESALAGEAGQTDGGRASRRAAADDRHRFSANFLAGQFPCPPETIVNQVGGMEYAKGATMTVSGRREASPFGPGGGA